MHEYHTNVYKQTVLVELQYMKQYNIYIQNKTQVYTQVLYKILNDKELVTYRCVKVHAGIHKIVHLLALIIPGLSKMHNSL